MGSAPRRAGLIKTFQGCSNGYGYVGELHEGEFIGVRCDSTFDRVHYSEVYEVSSGDDVWDMCINWHR